MSKGFHFNLDPCGAHFEFDFTRRGAKKKAKGFFYSRNPFNFWL